MPELRDHDPIDEVEALLRAASRYVRPSEDLRPRVLEAARSQRKDRQVRGYLRQAAIVLVVLGVLAAGLRQRLESLGNGAPGILATLASGVLDLPVETTAQRLDADWSMVDSFTELRRRQAELLRPAGEFRRAEFPRPKA